MVVSSELRPGFFGDGVDSADDEPAGHHGDEEGGGEQ
jgi:hypothetical protein